jgi:hypothetical protein
MKILLSALLFAGLFFSNLSFAQVALCPVGIHHPNYGCLVPAQKKPGYVFDYEGVAGQPAETIDKAFASLASAFKRTTTSTHNDGNCTSTTTNTRSLSLVVVVPPSGVDILRISSTSVSYSPNTPGYQCPSSPPSNNQIPASIWARQVAGVFVCPSDDHPDFLTLYKIDGVEYCTKPARPIDCSALAGVSSVGTSFMTKKDAGYTHPSCATKCVFNTEGLEQCGNCKVVAKSWTQNSSSTSDMIKWTPLVGTFTGVACGADEQDKQPDEKPTCWQTKNNLKMCQADPNKECKTVNGVRSCTAGCGEINGDFWCKTDGNAPREPNKDGDKPLPEIDDNITNPEKSLQDMQKGDFKDVLKGVESRISASTTGIGNLENSVDTTNNTLLDIHDTLIDQTSIAESQTDQLGQINSKLGDIADGLGAGGGGGDGDGEGEGGDGECDPNKSPDCVAQAGVTSWWNSSYEDGLGGLFEEKMNDFENSDVYAQLNTPLSISGGGANPTWNFCMNFGFADYGCEEIKIPDLVWTFIKACILFGAAILCRRLLIGA